MGGITQIIFSVFGSLLYPMFSIIFTLIDVIQNIFFAFAGLETVYFGGRTGAGIAGGNGDVVTSDGPGAGNFSDNGNGILYYLLRSETVQNILISLTILGVFLLIIFTIFAFIKNMYQAKQKRWQEIISSTIKGLINFLLVPSCCLLGVIMGTVLLRALNDATARSTDITIARQLFVTSAYNANKFRDQWDGDTEDVKNLEDLYNKTFSTKITLKEGQSAEYYAGYLDEVFKSKNGPGINSWWDVDDWYNLWSINYLIIVAGGIFILFALIKICFGALKRLFMLILLFVISPVVCSLYPIQEDSVSKWRAKFLEQFFSIFGAVIGMNLFFELVPLINSIHLMFWNDPLGVIPLLVTIAGLYMVTDFINLVQQLIPNAGQNVLDAGSQLSNSAKGGFKKGAGIVGGAVGGTIGAFTRAGAAERTKQSYLRTHMETDKYTDKSGVSHSLKQKEGESDSDFAARQGTEEYKGAMKNLKTEAGSGFFGSMGKTVKDTAKSKVDYLANWAGFGKPTERVEKFKKDYKDTTSQAEEKQKERREGEFKEKKMGNAMKSGNLEEIYQTIQDMKKAPEETRNTGWDLAKKDSGVQQSLKSFNIGGKEYGYKDPSKVSFDEYADLITRLYQEDKIQQQREGVESKINTATIGAVDSLTVPSGALTDFEKSASNDYLRRGSTEDAEKEFKREATANGISEARQTDLLKAMKDYLNTDEGKDYSRELNTANATIKSLTARELDAVKGINTDNMNDNMSNAIVSKLGELQNTFDRLDHGEKLVKLDTTSAQGFNNMKEAVKEMSRKITEAIKNEQKTIKEVLSSKKDKPKS